VIKWRLDPGQIEVVDDAIADILRRKTPAERVAMALDSNRTARLLVAEGVRRQHPEWADDRVRAEVARRMLGDAG